MSQKTVVTCDRCGADLTGTDHFTIGQIVSRMDFCKACKGSFYRWLRGETP
jgi:hypothetical protein